MKNFIKIGLKNGQTVDIEWDFETFKKEFNNAEIFIVREWWVVVKSEIVYFLPAIQEWADEELTKDQIIKIAETRTRELNNLNKFIDEMEVDKAKVWDIIEATNKMDYEIIKEEWVTTE